MRFTQSYDDYAHLKHYFVAHILRFVAGQRPSPSSIRRCPARHSKGKIMRTLENVAMAMAFLGAQSLAIATILIH